MRRIFYFLITNLAILLIISLVIQIFGIQPYLTANGIDYTSLILFALVFGMGGSFISLLLSKWTAKRLTGAKVIVSASNPMEEWLLDAIDGLSKKSQIKIPEVAIFPSDDPNAFATGANKNNALVAVSTGLLEQMDHDQIKAVLAHEISHIVNGDMITLSLIQGVINAFVFFISRIVGDIVDRVVFRNERGRGPGYWLTVIFTQIVLAILASIIVFWFSRKREYRADEGAVGLTDKSPMISVLQALKAFSYKKHLPQEISAFGISGKNRRGLIRLFSTHPDLDDRIKAIKNL